MKVILLEDIRGVGKKDQVLDVKDGYAKNFLFKQKKAVMADANNMKNLESKLAAREFDIEKKRENAKKLAKDLTKITVKIEAVMGDTERLFGTITTAEIAAALKTQEKIEVDKRNITLEDKIQTPGIYLATIKLYEGVTTKMKVLVKGIKK